MHFSAKIRITPLVLAGLIFMNCLGIYFIAFTQIGFHRIAEYAHSTEPATTLSLSADEWKNVNWIGSRDFIYQGNVYDLDRVSVSDGMVHLKVSVDTDERNTIDRLSDNDRDHKPSSAPSLKDIFKSISEFDAPAGASFRISSESPVSTYTVYLASSSNVTRTVLAPPPRVA